MRAPTSFENGRYSVLTLLGEGGMARVYMALDRRLGRLVAIKVPLPDIIQYEKVVHRFGQEATTMARATHPNVVTLYDAAAETLEDGMRTPYLVMELVRGVNAEDVFYPRKGERFGALSPRIAARIVLPVLSALADLHAGGLVHRDIKPGNIMIGWNLGSVKLMDFGIARIAQDAESPIPDGDRQTKTRAAMYSEWYSAPEQHRCAKTADARADLFAVAATLYALVTGMQPVDIEENELDSPEFLRVPECLREIIFRETRYRRDDRPYRTAAEFSEAIVRAVRGEPDTDADEANFLAWLQRRRDDSDVEAEIRRAFRGGYTIVPEIEEEDRTTQEADPEPVSQISKPARPRSVLSRYMTEIALTALGAACILLVVVTGMRFGLFAPNEEDPVPRQEELPISSVDVSAASDSAKPETDSPALMLPESDEEDPPMAVRAPVAPRDRRLPRVEPVLSEVETVAEVVPEPPTAPAPPKGTVLLAEGASSIALIGSNGTRYSVGSVPPGTYRIQAVFPEKGTAPNAGTVSVSEGQTVRVTCNEAFKLCNAR